MEKMNKREYFEAIKAVIADIEGTDEYVAFLDGEVAKLDARAEKERAKRAAKKAEGDELKDAVLAAIQDAGKVVTADDILEVIDFPEATRAKVIYRATALVKEGLIEKADVKVEKRKVVGYKVAGVDAE